MRVGEQTAGHGQRPVLRDAPGQGGGAQTEELPRPHEPPQQRRLRPGRQEDQARLQGRHPRHRGRRPGAGVSCVSLIHQKLVRNVSKTN